MEGHGHKPLNFYAHTKEFVTYKCWSPKDQDMLKTQENQCWSITPPLVIGRRSLVHGPEFQKMGVASWHKRTQPHQIPSTCERIYPYSHYNSVYEWHAWKLTPPLSPNFNAFNGWDYTYWPQVSWDLEVGNPCEQALGHPLIPSHSPSLSPSIGLESWDI